MPEYIYSILFFVGLVILERLYFKFALRYKIIDKPNERSSHKRFTIRGGGIIFPISVFVWWLLSGFLYSSFVVGLLLISAVSFIDDIRHLHSRTRFLAHAFAIVTILHMFSGEVAWYWLLLILTIGVGVINAWNFMDGINGITGTYSLVTLSSLFYVNQFLYQFVDRNLLAAVILAVLVFNFFNFRKKAHCFAGDVGSVSIAFIICFLLVKLIAATGNMLYLALILLYGLDTLTTIVFRLIRKENIFEAHRSHFYQFLVNEQKWPHLAVSTFYGIIQGIVNLLLITQFYPTLNTMQSVIELVAITVVSLVVFLVLRFVLEGHSRLFGKEVQPNRGLGTRP